MNHKLNIFISYDDIWDGTSKKSGNDFTQKMVILTGGFERYMKEYFYEAKVSLSITHIL